MRRNKAPVMYYLLKPLLFLLSPERAHHISTFFLDVMVRVLPGVLKRWYCIDDEALQRTVMGLRFPNPVGLAAGFDKDGRHLDGLSMLGFGFIEVGTVTPLGQEGNPKPRLFRLLRDRALVNRMGFNNEGLDALVIRLKSFRERGVPRGVVIGGNIGKNKATPNERAHEDYIRCFDALFPWVDYFVVNVSSPNTPNLRELQDKEPLMHLLSLLQDRNCTHAIRKPILLKIAPDLTWEQLGDISEIVKSTGLAGIVATNTTISRSGLKTDEGFLVGIGSGGLSGAPVRARSTEVIGFMRKQLGPDFVIIGVGGIDSPEAAREKMDAGADLIQVYSGLVYEGPGLVKFICKWAAF